MPIAPSVQLGKNVTIFHPDLVNLYGCQIGSDTKIGTFVEIQAGASVGARCKISSHSFICEGVEIGDEVFVGGAGAHDAGDRLGDRARAGAGRTPGVAPRRAAGRPRATSSRSRARPFPGRVGSC